MASRFKQQEQLSQNSPRGSRRASISSTDNDGKSSSMQPMRRKIAELGKKGSFIRVLAKKDTARSVSTPLEKAKTEGNILQDRKKLIAKKLDLINFNEKNFKLSDQEDVELLVELLQRRHKKKSEINCLARTFQELEFFQTMVQKLSHMTYVSLIRHLEHIHCPKHTTIFEKGQKGEKFYIILTGAVAVLEDNENLTEEEVEQLKVEQKQALAEEEQKQMNLNKTKMSTAHKSRFANKRRDSIKLEVDTSQRLIPTAENTDSADKSAASLHSATKRKAILPGQKSVFQRPALHINTRQNNVQSSPGHQLHADSPYLNQSSGDGSSPYRDSPRVKNSPIRGKISAKEKFQFAVNETIADRGSPSKGKFMGAFKQAQLEKYNLDLKKLESLESQKEGEASPTDSVKSKIEEDTMDNFLKRSYPLMKVSNQLVNGKAFGELALEMPNCKRTATVVTSQDTHFAILTKEAYDRILKDYYQNLYKDKIEFLKSLYIFSDLSNARLSSIMMGLDIITINKNTPIFNIGEPTKNLYFIRKGEVELYEPISWKEKTSVQESIDIVKKGRIDENSKFKIKKMMKVIARLGPGSIVGEQEIIEKQIHRKQMALAESHQVILYVMQKEKIGDYLKKRLQEQIELKNKWRNDLRKNISNQIASHNERFKDAKIKLSSQENSLNNDHKQLNDRFVIWRKSHSTSKLEPAPKELVPKSRPKPKALQPDQQNVTKTDGTVNELSNASFQRKENQSVPNHPPKNIQLQNHWQSANPAFQKLSTAIRETSIEAELFTSKLQSPSRPSNKPQQPQKSFVRLLTNNSGTDTQRGQPKIMRGSDTVMNLDVAPAQTLDLDSANRKGPVASTIQIKEPSPTQAGPLKPTTAPSKPNNAQSRKTTKMQHVSSKPNSPYIDVLEKQESFLKFLAATSPTQLSALQGSKSPKFGSGKTIKQEIDSLKFFQKTSPTKAKRPSTASQSQINVRDFLKDLRHSNKPRVKTRESSLSHNEILEASNNETTQPASFQYPRTRLGSANSMSHFFPGSSIVSNVHRRSPTDPHSQTYLGSRTFQKERDKIFDDKQLEYLKTNNTTQEDEGNALSRFPMLIFDEEGLENLNLVQGGGGQPHSPPKKEVVNIHVQKKLRAVTTNPNSRRRLIKRPGLVKGKAIQLRLNNTQETADSSKIMLHTTIQ